ncbi:hypothetical protein LPJ57_007881, partial [Coemansia sp. RSA 486]
QKARVWALTSEARAASEAVSTAARIQTSQKAMRLPNCPLLTALPAPTCPQHWLPILTVATATTTSCFLYLKRICLPTTNNCLLLQRSWMITPPLQQLRQPAKATHN